MSNNLIIEMELLNLKDKSITNYYDNTRLVANNTCPTWGVVRYLHHKTYKSSSRAMALEIGSAAHELFAADRLFDLLEHGPNDEWYPDVSVDRYIVYGRQLFGEDRFDEMMYHYDSGEDFDQRRLNFSLSCLEHGSFYDDPGDKRRIKSILEESIMAYLGRRSMDHNLPVVTDHLIGIEVPLILRLR